MNPSKRIQRFVFAGVIIPAAIGLMACSAREDASTSGSLAVTSNEADGGEDGAAVVEGSDAGAVVTTPKFVEVSANGTGCPAGTWTAQVAEDGHGFLVRFSAFEASIAPGKVLDVSDCQLAIKIDAPEGISYSVSKLNFAASELLDQEGMTARQTVKHYFQGDPVTGVEHTREIAGPTSPEPYSLQDSIGEDDAVWSPCGAARDLNVSLRLMVRNNPAKTGTGKLGASGAWMLTGSLRTRSCS
jgi:hypothetical protein